ASRSGRSAAWVAASRDHRDEGTDSQLTSSRLRISSRRNNMTMTVRPSPTLRYQISASWTRGPADETDVPQAAQSATGGSVVVRHLDGLVVDDLDDCGEHVVRDARVQGECDERLGGLVVAGHLHRGDIDVRVPKQTTDQPDHAGA